MFSDQNSTYECHYIGFDIIKLRFNNWKLVWIKHPKLSLILGFPPEFRVTVYVRKWSGNFFHFHYGKGSGKPEFRNDFFFVKRKFPERCSGITDRYGIPENFRFPFILELSMNSGLRNKFPDHSISKMETFFRKNGNPTWSAVQWPKNWSVLVNSVSIFFFKFYKYIKHTG